MQRIYVTNAGWSRLGWGPRLLAILGVALGLALAVAFVVLALGIAMILLPVVAVAAAIGWWRWRKLAASVRDQAAQPQPPEGIRVIEADYEVVPRDGRRAG